MSSATAALPAATFGRQARAFVVAAFCLYAPFSWLLLYPHWNGYWWTWMKLWPILPGFVPGALLFHPHDLPEFLTMGVVTVALLASLTWLGSGGGWRLVAAALISLAVSIPSAILAHGAFVA